MVLKLLVGKPDVVLGIPKPHVSVVSVLSVAGVVFNVLIDGDEESPPMRTRLPSDDSDAETVTYILYPEGELVLTEIGRIVPS